VQNFSRGQWENEEAAMLNRILVVCCAMTLAVTATAQTIGSYVLWPDTALDTSSVIIGVPPDPARTYINLSGPATANGTIRMVAFRTAGASVTHPCNDAVKIKFFRRSGDTVNFITERGPFSVNATITKVNLSPPVDVLAGDLIGITLLQDCGLGGLRMGPIGQALKTEGTAFIQGDASGAYSLHAGPGVTAPPARLIPALALSVFGSATTDAEVRSQIIVVAGSAPGVGGSRFKTDIQMANVPGPDFLFNAPLRGDTVLGRLVYHAAGIAGTPSDPSVPFKLGPGEARTFLDFVATLGLSGLGSIDVYTTVGFESPLAVARIYEDSAGATKGLAIDALTPDRALQEDAILFAPTDPAKFRMNIGVRTLDHPVTLGFAIFRSNGTARTATITHDYLANQFVQDDATHVLGTTLEPGDYIVVRGGLAPASAFVYGSIIDNTSQDPSVQFASVLR
jgi:hypothetical protein